MMAFARRRSTSGLAVELLKWGVHHKLHHRTQRQVHRHVQHRIQHDVHHHIQRRIIRLLVLGLVRNLVRHVAYQHRGGAGSGKGFGFGFGPGFRGGFGGGRRFGRGDLKYVILDLLQDEPRHGYDIIRALEERFHGFYSPSPGSVYPTLQLLEDQGYVTSAERDGKRVYTITEAGRAFLKERADTVEDVRARAWGGWTTKMGPEMRDLVDEFRQIGQTMFAQGGHGAFGDPEKMRKIKDVVARARRDIEAIFRGEADSSSGETKL